MCLFYLLSQLPGGVTSLDLDQIWSPLLEKYQSEEMKSDIDKSDSTPFFGHFDML